ncbi:ABC transporter permease [Candidatus Bathyarchaeota archaeon]|nr:MAG: ABC transporter permease [Candidatus Bathyarchaeota archaeon]
MKLKESIETIIYFFISIGIILVGWEAFSRLNILSPSLISRPSEIFAVLYDLLSKTAPSGMPLLLAHIYSSLYRLLYAYLIALAIGIGLGILMGQNDKVYWFFEPLITLALPIPGIAWAPIFMVWLGFGDPTILTVGVLAAFFPIVYNTAAGVRSIKKELIWAAQSMGADEKTIFFKVLLPASLGYIFTGIKLGLARGWRTIIAVEMIAGTLWGLGFMIYDAREYLRPSIIYAGIIVLAVTYFVIEGLIKLLEKRTIEKWGMVRKEAI